MTNLRKWIDEMERVAGEPVRYAVFGEGDVEFPELKLEIVYAKEKIPEAALDREFRTGFGAAKVQSFVMWSENYVFFCQEYNGATWWDRLPRNPEGCRMYYGGMKTVNDSDDDVDDE